MEMKKERTFRIEANGQNEMKMMINERFNLNELLFFSLIPFHFHSLFFTAYFDENRNDDEEFLLRKRKCLKY